ncbi:MAG: hypothetical protein Q9220_003103 [cf. Caloplaca sp. 1 TL-2023]
MARPPAVVFVARHGARLDAADKQWHLTSPTPYDPPLTYGGWIQSRALGNRIGSILHARIVEAEDGDSGQYTKANGVHPVSEANNGLGKSKKRHKVIIHTSPFLRCIQTSIAISAGIAQYEGSLQPSNHQPRFSKHHQMHSEIQHPTHGASPLLTSNENRDTPHLSAIPEPEVVDGDAEQSSEEAVDPPKPRLRLDAFLGEWLSPEYFDLITPPPSSVMMLVGSKNELMRQGEYVDVPAGSYKGGQSKGNFPGGWGGGAPAASDREGHAAGPLSSVSTIAASLPRLNRASSHSIVTTSDLSNSHRVSPKTVSKIETSANPRQVNYEPPTPSYAISPSDPIPPGYVAHARDGCIDVDFGWDSMRKPHDWGNGGEYGEEWSAMHKRFRRGLQGMMTWYQHYHVGLNTQMIKDGSDQQSEATEEIDEDTDLVLILVTHGAGCNALIGALTNQPVLLDVGMASLTMAVRKDMINQQPSSPISPNAASRRRRSSVDSGVSAYYDVKITASTEHLHSRSRSSTAGLQHGSSPSLMSSSSPISTHRYRTSSAASTTSSGSVPDTADFVLDPDSRVINAPHRDGAMTGARSLGSSAGGGGLWSKAAVPARTINVVTDQLPKDKNPRSGHSPLAQEVTSTNEFPIKQESKRDGAPSFDGSSEKANGAPSGGHPKTQSGLWGAPPPSATAANEREKGFKRRWTHSEQR